MGTNIMYVAEKKSPTIELLYCQGCGKAQLATSDWIFFRDFRLCTEACKSNLIKRNPDVGTIRSDWNEDKTVLQNIIKESADPDYFEISRKNIELDLDSFLLRKITQKAKVTKVTVNELIESILMTELGNYTLSTGSLVLRTGSKKVYMGGKPVELTKVEFRLLEFLLRHKGVCVTREQIFNRVWNTNAESFYSSVDVHILHLRRKLLPGYIEAVYGVGYKINDIA